MISTHLNDIFLFLKVFKPHFNEERERKRERDRKREENINFNNILDINKDEQFCLEGLRIILNLFFHSKFLKIPVKQFVFLNFMTFSKKKNKKLKCKKIFEFKSKKF